MPKWKLVLSVVSLSLGLFLLPGCNLGTPVCANNNLQQVTLGAPQNWTITNNPTPVLSWSYPDNNCHPESYRILLNTVANIPQSWDGQNAGTSTTWGPATSLLPGMEYEWAVTPFNGTVYGPMSGYHLFFTGPMCNTASLHAPLLDLPIDGNVVHSLMPQLVWHYPDPCLPQGYRVDLSTDPTFTDTSLSGGTGNPSFLWSPAHDLADCTTYFWRVAPINGTTLGPFSSVDLFRTSANGDVYDCNSEPAAIVSGFLWYDQCPVALEANPVPNPLPAGCVVDSYGVDADGIHQSGEPFMSNISVNLGPGDCPSGGPMTTLTDINGAYSFIGLTPGKYCLNVNAASFVGPGGTGHWSLIPSGHEGNTYRSILLGAGETLSSQNFAWYQNTSISTEVPAEVPTSTPTPVSGYFFIPDFNANCHSGPGLAYDVLAVAMKGQSYPLDGRNQAGDWVRLMQTPGMGCWVAASSGIPSADLSGLRVLISPPTPPPTPLPTSVVDCASYKDQRSCNAQPACQWKPSLAGPGVCANK